MQPRTQTQTHVQHTHAHTRKRARKHTPRILSAHNKTACHGSIQNGDTKTVSRRHHSSQSLPLCCYLVLWPEHLHFRTDCRRRHIAVFLFTHLIIKKNNHNCQNNYSRNDKIVTFIILIITIATIQLDRCDRMIGVRLKKGIKGFQQWYLGQQRRGHPQILERVVNPHAPEPLQ
jgi:hypothetical protein